MPLRKDWLSRIEDVEREHLAIRQAVDRFREEAYKDATILRDNLKSREIDKASKNLEGTYIIRFFAEFENGARQYYNSIKDSVPKTSDLLNSLSAKCKIPHNLWHNVNMVRDYRNSLVHESEDKDVKPVPIAQVHNDLRQFFRRLPWKW